MTQFISRTILIQSSQQKTDYIIGSGLLEKIHTFVQIQDVSITKFLLLADKTVFQLYGDKIKTSLEKTGKKIVISLVQSSEKQKSLQAIPSIVQPFLRETFDKHAVLITLGGGIVTDMGNFLGSILLRGIQVIHIPTTLLAQIDAAIGGKGGVNFQGNDGLMYKNMIGTIVQPSAVLSDIETLSSLPETEIINGLGEMVKYWVGWGTPSEKQLQQFSRMKYMAARQLIDVVHICQSVKLNTVISDPYDKTGKRQLLNLGHTIGHGLESAAKGKLSHGQSVAIGLIAAAKISLYKKRISQATYNHIVNVIEAVGLPAHVANIAISDVLQSMKMDKKGGKFVLIDDIGKLSPNANVEKQLIEKILKEIVV